MPWDTMVALSPRRSMVALLPHAKYQFTLVLLLDVGGSEAAATASLNDVERRWAARGGIIKRSTADKVALVSAEFPAQAPASAGRDRVGFIHRGILCLCEDTAVATTIIARLDAQSESLASLPAFAKVRELAAPKPFAGDGKICWFLQPLQMLRAPVAGAAKEKKRAERLRLFERQGFDVIEAVGGTLRCVDANIDYVAVAIHGKPLVRAAKMLPVQAGRDFAPPNWITGQIAELGLVNWDWATWLEGYAAYYDELSGEGAAGAFDDMLNSLKSDADGPKVDLRHDLFDQLTGNLVQLHDFHADQTDKTKKQNPARKRTLVASQVKDPKVVRAAIDRFFADDPQVQVSDIGNNRLWHAKKETASLFGTAGNAPLKISVDGIGVAGNYLFISSHRALLANLLAGKGTPAGDRNLPRLITRQTAEPLCAASRLEHRRRNASDSGAGQGGSAGFGRDLARLLLVALVCRVRWPGTANEPGAGSGHRERDVWPGTHGVSPHRRRMVVQRPRRREVCSLRAPSILQVRG